MVLPESMDAWAAATDSSTAANGRGSWLKRRRALWVAGAVHGWPMTDVCLEKMAAAAAQILQTQPNAASIQKITFPLQNVSTDSREIRIE